MIDNLPSGWKVEELGNTYVSNIIIMGQSPDSKTYNKNKIGLPFYQGKKDFGKKYPSPSEYCSIPKKIAEKNDILFCVRAPVGITNIASEKCCIGRGLSAIRVNSNNCLMDFIRYFFIKNEKCIADKGKGSTFTAISKNDLENILVPIPPLQQQEKIVKVLDLTSNLIEKQKELLKKYDLFLKSKFIEMFGDPILNPMGWEVVKCIDVADCIVPGRDKPKSFTGNIPWITTSDLKDKGIIFKSKENIGLSQIEINEVKAKLIPKNSVIFTCVGELGLCSITNENIIMNQQLHSFQCRDKINNIFLMFDISMQKSYMYKMATSTTVPYMNKTTCNNIPTILPPIELQNKFASIVKKIETIKEKENQKLKQFEDLHNSMMNKAFKGEIK